MEKIYGDVWKSARMRRARIIQQNFCSQEYSTAVVVYTAASDSPDATDGVRRQLLLMLLILNFSTVPIMAGSHGRCNC